MEKTKFQNLLKTLGPGILFASTAIGVSHLVQSTRAGANFGFALVPIILAANVFKYPFFEFGSRYANATGESIIDGYRRIGKWMLWLYFLITVGSMFFVCAAVGAVTTGFLQNLFGIGSWGIWATFGLFTFCGVILLAGKYKLLDSGIKVIGALLLISTLTAFALALFHGPSERLPSVQIPDLFGDNSIIFMIALMGWMPTAVDLSAWNSLWTIERIKQTGYKPTLKETLLDFNFGYIVSALLSLCFVTLGAYMLFGTGKALPDKSGDFAAGVVHLFTDFIGEWSYPIISLSAFSIMFGTCIAVFDGYGRALERTMVLLVNKEKEDNQDTKGFYYSISLTTVIIGAFMVVLFLGAQMKNLVDLATIISFVIAPIIAIVNYRLVTGPFIDEEFKPPVWLKILSWLGMIFLITFALWFLFA